MITTTESYIHSILFNIRYLCVQCTLCTSIHTIESQEYLPIMGKCVYHDFEVNTFAQHSYRFNKKCSVINLFTYSYEQQIMKIRNLEKGEQKKKRKKKRSQTDNMNKSACICTIRLKILGKYSD